MSKLILLNKFDLTPSGKIVEKPEIGGEGYLENIEYEICVAKLEDSNIIVYWYGEDETEMSLEEYIAKCKKN